MYLYCYYRKCTLQLLQKMGGVGAQENAVFVFVPWLTMLLPATATVELPDAIQLRSQPR